MHFLWAVEFLATFNFQTDKTVVIFYKKLQNNIFLESLHNSLKMC